MTPPPPSPELLTKDFPPATRSRLKIFTKENLVGAKIAPTAVSRTLMHALSKENQVSLVRSFLSEPSFWARLRNSN